MGTIPARMCPTAQTYQNHQIYQGVEGAELGGLYTRIVINDFLPQYPGRAPFQPGLSEYGATKSWTGSPMASLQRAVLMLRKLHLFGIPRDIRNALRLLQDAYSEELDLDGSDTISQGSIELGESEEAYSEEGRGGKHEGKRKGGELKPASENIERDGHIPNEDKERTSASKGAVHSEANLEVVLSDSRLRHQDTGCALEQSHNTSRFWRWGPYATSEDAAKFFQRVL